MVQSKSKHVVHAVKRQTGFSGHALRNEIAKGAMVGAIVQTGGKLMSKITNHPAIVFGLGVVTGCFIY